MSAALPPSPFLYPITDSRLGGGPAGSLAGELFTAGARVVQIRDKALDDGEFFMQVQSAAAAARASGGLLFVNDRLDVALLAGADGIHLGDGDLPVPEVRRLVASLLPPRTLRIGCSSHSVEQALSVARLAPDYIALGPIYASSTKPGRPPLGADAIRQVRQRTRLPLIAIGGIDAQRLAEVVDAGADGVAVISAVMVPGAVRSRCSALVEQLTRR